MGWLVGCQSSTPSPNVSKLSRSFLSLSSLSPIIIFISFITLYHLYHFIIVTLVPCFIIFTSVSCLPSHFSIIFFLYYCLFNFYLLYLLVFTHHSAGRLRSGAETRGCEGKISGVQDRQPIPNICSASSVLISARVIETTNKPFHPTYQSVQMFVFSNKTTEEFAG